MKTSRRCFLAAVSASAAVLPLLRGMPSYAAEEQPRYLILVFSPNGRVRHEWGAMPAGAENGLVFRRGLSPLQPFAEYVTLPVGLQNGAGRSLGVTHGAGMSSLWTGQAAVGKGPSIDQIVAAELGQGQRPSLEFRVESTEDELVRTPNNRMIFDHAGTPIEPRSDARVALRQIFGISASEGSAEQTNARREVLLEELNSELRAINPRLCADDRVHLDALRGGWETIRKRLSQPPNPNCQAPVWVEEEPNYLRRSSRELIDLLVMSLACDITRVASLQLTQARSDMIATFAGLSEKHHEMSHQVAMSTELLMRNEAGELVDRSMDPPEDLRSKYGAVWEKLLTIEQFYAEEFAYLLQRLSDSPSLSGKSLLDDSLIVWGTEIDNGQSHDHFNMPLVLAGGAAGRLARGKLIEYPLGIPAGTTLETPPGTRFHNDLLVTIAKLMGGELSSIGPEQFNTGVLTDLLA